MAGDTHTALRAAAAAACLALAAGTALSAADVAAPIVTARPGVLNLRTGDVAVVNLPNLLDGAAFPNGKCVVMLDSAMTPERRAALAGAGLTLRGYLPLNAFIADMGAATPQQLGALGFVTWVGAYRDEWKVDAEVIAGANGRAWRTPERIALAAAGQSAVNVWLFEGEPLAPALAALSAVEGARVISSEQVADGFSIAMVVPARAAPGLARIAAVQYVEMLAEYTPRSNAATRGTVQSGSVNATPLYDRGIHGEGQIIAIMDFGLAQNHCSFVDPVNPIGPLHRKLQAYNISPQYDWHGTHVCGTAVGDAGTNGDTRGVAYNARLVFNFPPNLSEASHVQRYTLHESQGAFVHSNSFGDDSTTAYDGGCRGIDSFQFTNDSNLILYAVTDLLSFVRNPENAKNCLAVSVSGNPPDENTNTCFAGGNAPTADGRRKPEITAPGCSITSATGSTGCGLTTTDGTSMSTPAVGGLAILVRQYFTSGFYPSGIANASHAFTPSGPLIKAMIINSAADMTGFDGVGNQSPSFIGYPTDREGWGRVLADNSAYFAGDARRLIVKEARNGSGQAVPTGQSRTYFFHTGPCGLPLRVTLVFHDAPAQVNATLTPVNDLNLVVTAPDGTVYRGNVFSDGFSIAGGAADTINNTEQVHIASPQVGAWTARVDGAAVNSATPQGFALVITGGADEEQCGSADFNCDGDSGTDADIEGFFLALGGGGPGDADFDRDGDTGTDADIEAFFRVLGGGGC